MSSFSLSIETIGSCHNSFSCQCTEHRLQISQICVRINMFHSIMCFNTEESLESKPRTCKHDISDVFTSDSDPMMIVGVILSPNSYGPI